MDEDDVTRKIKELFSENPAGSELTMCYVTSEMMYTSITKTKREVKFYDTEQFYNFATMYPLLNIELTLTSKKLYDNDAKNSLTKKYGIERAGYANSVFKYAKLRIFMHAFNIFRLRDGSYLWSQSWFNVQTYGIKKRFTFEEYAEHVTQLVRAINTYAKEPQNLFDVCFYDEEIDANTKNILKMVVTTKIEYDVLLKCNY